MPTSSESIIAIQAEQKPLSALPFPPISPEHILNCSFHTWYPLFRSLTPKSRVIPLSPAFLSYLRADGILLPPEHKRSPNEPEDSGYDDEDDDNEQDPSEEWPEIHAQIQATIKELGGKVVPKLNWSAPKDATWISATNDMECRTANDVYLLLKSSDFITHDLEHAFDGCTVREGKAAPEVPYHLVLRKSFNLNPSLEFRCFVRQRRLIAVSQREMNYFDFLFDLRSNFKRLIQDFNDEKILRVAEGGKGGFPEESFVVDVYIPPPHEKVWLIDINPWAPRTDPLLFSWLELLTMDVPEANVDSQSEDDADDEDEPDAAELEEGVVRLKIQQPSQTNSQPQPQPKSPHQSSPSNHAHISGHEEVAEAEAMLDPEFRLVHRDDPEAYQFSATKYSAHKLPKEIVDASMAPSDMKNMMEEWKRVVERQGQEGESESDEEEDDGENGT